MITEVPTPADFQAAGFNQLYLAWQLAIRAVEDLEFAEENVDLGEDQAAAKVEYWAKSQPTLANAFGLIQQAMEMALKGRIASVSPYLLIPRDPRDWPKGVDTVAIPFSEFRTLDAADLIKVHNTFISPALDEKFRTFWEAVRRDRNKIMHSVAPRSFDPATLVRALLIAATALFSDVRWPQRLLDMEEDGKYAAFGMDDGSQNTVMRQMDIAVRHLTTSECQRLLGHDKRRRSYVCPNCHGQANRDWQSEWPHLAQMVTKTPGEQRLHCLVCDATTTTERVPCPHPGCQGDVMFEGQCMTCLLMEDDPRLLLRENQRVMQGQPTRFDKGDARKLEALKTKARFKERTFYVHVVQPGLSASQAKENQLELLAATEVYTQETFQMALNVIGSK